MTSGDRAAQRPTADVLAAVLHAQPGVLAQLVAAHEAAWRVVDPVLLELCRLRVAALLGCRSEQAARTPAATRAGLDETTVAALADWPTSARFGPRERACLAFCEQWVMDVAGTPDDLARDVADHLGAAGLRDLAGALLVVEQRQRLRLAFEALDLPAAA